MQPNKKRGPCWHHVHPGRLWDEGIPGQSRSGPQPTTPILKPESTPSPHCPGERPKKMRPSGPPQPPGRTKPTTRRSAQLPLSRSASYSMSVSFFLELSWVMHMATSATTEMTTMYHAGAIGLPVA